MKNLDELPLAPTREPSLHVATVQSRAAAVRSKKEAESLVLSQQIAKARENGGADERERARRRHITNIESFCRFMRAILDARLSANTTPSKIHTPASFKMICALIKQRAQEDVQFVEPKHRRTLGFHYLMANAPAYWISISDQLLAHARAGTLSEIVALGPFAGLRVSTRAILINKDVLNVVQLRAAIGDGSLRLDEDIASNGLTRRRWAELLAWLKQQPL